MQRYRGWITPEDMAAHTSTWEKPITARDRDLTLYQCPPNGQGLAAIIAVNLAAGLDLAAMDAADRAHVMIECMRLAFANAWQWVADPCQADIPLDNLLSPKYAARRRRQIDMQRTVRHARAGIPAIGSDTVYVSVVDGEGNACSFGGWQPRTRAWERRTPGASSWSRRAGTSPHWPGWPSGVIAWPRSPAMAAVVSAVAR